MQSGYRDIMKLHVTATLLFEMGILRFVGWQREATRKQ